MHTKHCSRHCNTSHCTIKRWSIYIITLYKRDMVPALHVWDRPLIPMPSLHPSQPSIKQPLSCDSHSSWPCQSTCHSKKVPAPPPSTTHYLSACLSPSPSSSLLFVRLSHPPSLMLSCSQPGDMYYTCESSLICLLWSVAAHWLSVLCNSNPAPLFSPYYLTTQVPFG